MARNGTAPKQPPSTTPRPDNTHQVLADPSSLPAPFREWLVRWPEVGGMQLPYSQLLGAPAQPGWVNVHDFGMKGNNLEAEAEGNQRALEAALAAAADIANLHTRGIVFVPPGTYRITDHLLIPSAVTLMGLHPEASKIIPAAGFNDTDFLIRNEAIDASQEFASIVNMGFLGGRDYGVDLDTVLLFDTMGGDRVLDNIVVTAASAEGITLDCTGAGSCGPMVFNNVWVNDCDGHCILVHAPVIGTRWNGQLKVERPGTNKAGVYFENAGLATNGNHFINALYNELAAAGHAMWIENTTCVFVGNHRGGAIRLMGSGTGQFSSRSGLDLNSLQISDNPSVEDDCIGLDVDGPIIRHYPFLPTVSVYTGSDQSLTDSTLTFIDWDTEDFDTGALHTGSGDVVILEDGNYSVDISLEYASNTTGGRGVVLYKNGGVVKDRYYPPTPGGLPTSCPFHWELPLVDGDTLAVKGYQTSGGALNVLAGSRFQAKRLPDKLHS